MNTPKELLYSKSHEWVAFSGDTAKVELINQSPYEAWLFEVGSISDKEELLDAAAYEAFCAEEE